MTSPIPLAKSLVEKMNEPAPDAQPKPVGELTHQITLETAETVAKARGFQSFDEWVSAQERRYDRDMPWMRERHTRVARYIEYVQSSLKFAERNDAINKGNAELFNSLTGGN